ncbi:MAG: FecR domain-containing protein [Syntrophobacterales bacterium]|nr:FecR domain-containing protein [Syntrophobacterales bacterium]
MKRISVILSLLALLVVLPGFAQAAPVAKFTSIEGNVDVTTPGKAAVKANMGDPLNVGDIIRTKSKSKCEITFMDGSILRLAESSRLRVTEFSQEKEKRNATVDLFRGKVHNIVKAVGGQSKYEVRTPTAVCGVRGTQFYTYYQSGVSGAVVTEGTVYAYSSNKPGEVRMIGVGQAMVVKDANTPPTVRKATPKEVEQHQKDTKPAEKAKEEAKKDEEKKPEELAAKTGEGKKEEAKQEEKKEEQKPEAKADEKPAETKAADEPLETKAEESTTQKDSQPLGAGTPAPEANKPTEEAPKIVLASDNAAQREQSAIVDIVGRTTNETSTASSFLQPTLAPMPVPTIPDVPIVPPIADAAPPVITMTVNPDKFTNDNSATFIFKTDEKAAIKYRVDDGGWVEDTKYDTEFVVNLQTLAEKAHALIVEARDEAGNTATKEYSWATDYTAPTITLSGTPAVLTNAAAANIGVAVADASAVTTTYRLDGVAIASSALTGLSEGSHTLVVTATDAAGNSASKEYAWATDYTAPTITFSGTPSAVTKVNAANIGVAVADASAVTTTYQLDGVSVTSTDLTALSEKAHTLLVTATDAAGNVATQTYSWTTDYTAPTITLSGTPAALTNAAAANIGVTTTDASAVTATYQLDGALVTSTNLTAVSEGPHTLLVTATDAAGNIGTKEYAWTTDYTAPTITLSGTPAALTNAAAANIGVAVADASAVATTYQLDGKPVASADLTGLSEGSHTLVVTATDAAGNTGTKEYAWTTDYTAPTITLSGTPAALSTIKAANIGVATTDASAVTATTYILDGVVVASTALTALSEGPHTLLVTATDAAGNESSKDVSFTLDIYSLDGTITGFSGSVSGTAAGDAVGVAGDNWGGWNIAMTGSGNPPPNETGNIYAGGGNAESGYWLGIASVSADAGAETLSGTSQLDYLSKTRLGSGAGTITGTYDDAGNYQLSDIGIGSYAQTPLAFVSYLDDAGRYKTTYSEAAYADHIGDLWDILIGGTQSLWYDADGATIGASKTGMPFRVMGTYEHALEVENPANNIWYSTSVLNSYNYESATNTISDGGSYLGLMGGTETSSAAESSRLLAGRLLALYIDPLGNAGYLKGNMTGNAYPAIGMFAMDGSLAREQIKPAAEVGVAASELMNSKYWGYMNASLGGIFQDGSAYVGSLTASNNYSETFAIANWTTNVAQNWGIYGLTLYGSYETPAAVWGARMGGEGAFGAYPYTSAGTTYPLLDGDWGYSLSTINDGAWADGKISGAVDGRFLTHAKAGTMAGDLLGAYNTGDNTWEAVSLGTWTGTELSHVSDFYSGLMAQTRHYTGSYSYEDNGYYSYDYYTDNHYGHIYYRRPDPGITSYDVTYNQDGTWTKTLYSYSIASGYTATGTETGTLTQGTDISFIAAAADANYASASSNNYPYQYNDGSLTALLGGTDTLWTAAQATPAKLTMMGTYSSASALPHIWGGGYGYGNIASRNYMNDSGVTYDGGAYTGYLAGTEINRAMDARLVALYIDPAGNAGYLKGALAGTAYPEIGMLAMDGSAYPTQMTADPGIAPGEMVSHLTESGYYSYYDIGLAGAFDTGGKIVSDSNYSYESGFQTMSLVNHEMNRAEPWGIYGLGMSGLLEAPAAWTAWAAKAGGRGNFGAYNAANNYYGSYGYTDGGSYSYNYYTDNRSGHVAYMIPDPAITSYEITYNHDGSYMKIYYTYGEVPEIGGIDYYPTEVVTGTGFPDAGLSSIRTAEDPLNATLESESKNGVHDPDEGYWLAEITDGKAEGNKLTGTVNGRFITRTKMGNASVTAGALFGTGITGDLLGTYNTADDTWQAVSLGSWSGTPLAFGGEEDSWSSAFWQYRYPGYPEDPPLDSLTYGGQLMSQGFLQGLIGGTDTLFGSFDAALGNYPAVTLAGIGIYGNSEKFPLFLARFNGKNMIDETVATNGNVLFFSGVNLFDADGVPTSLAGNMGGLYWKKNPDDGKYELGVLSVGSGAMANLYPHPNLDYMGVADVNGMWELAPKTKLQAYSLFSGLSFTADPVLSDNAIGMFDNSNLSAEITEKMTNGYWKLWERHAREMRIADLSDLTVVAELTGGGYKSVVPPEAGARFNQADGFRYDVTEITGVDEANKLFTATTAAARIVPDEGNGGFTSIAGGVVKGSFDPVTATWRAAALLTGMETKAFLTKVSSMNDAQKQAFYDATKIPAFTVGTTDLRGQGSVIDMGVSDASRGIVNATFLAASTGGRPQLWASGNVNGAYTTTPEPGSTSVSLAGYQVGTGVANGITATFNIQSWDATKWGATVTSGSVPANTVTFTYPNAATTGLNFQGGAAGSISATTTTTGTFSGTAAGVVK